MSEQGYSDPCSPGSLAAPLAEDEFQFNGLYINGIDEEVERVYDYDKGGHHPVYLGDCLGDRQQYRVIHKLGSGGYGNVWLCRALDIDPPEYVALKVLMADASHEDSLEEKIISRMQEIARESPSVAEYVCLPLEKFRITGPNGSHLCLVYPAAGPEVSPFRKPVEDIHKTLRRIACQAAEAMAALHRSGICHGDFRPPNILFRTSGLNGMQEEEVLQFLGHPLTVDVLTESDEICTDPIAPSYLVYAVYYDRENSTRASDEICIIDFGEAFEVTSPPNELGLPLAYAPMETLFGGTPGPATDIWTLACTMFEIRTGHRLLSLFDNDRDDYISIAVDMFGPLPEPWWSSWEGREYYEPDGSREDTSLRGFLKHPVAHTLKDINGETQRSAIPQEELELFGDLLESMFQYDPAKRPSIEEVLKHPWFAFAAKMS